MKTISSRFAAIAACVAVSLFGLSGDGQLRAQDVLSEDDAYIQALIELDEAITPQIGTINIPQAQASFDLGEDYYFVPADQAKRILTDAWGNAPSQVTNVLGMVFPKDKTFTDETWGAVITFETTGYVSDSDAQDIDPAELLSTLKEGEAQHNEALRSQGYSGSVIQGWAQQPTYDKLNKSLIWAKDIKFDNSDQNTLNYDVRILGRKGVLSVNMVTVMSDLANVRMAAESLSKTAKYDVGARYADYNPDTDATAEYGLAGLVAAGAAAGAAKKLGILGGLLVFLKKLFIPILLGLGGVFAWLRGRVFGRKEEQWDEEYYDENDGVGDMPEEPQVR